MNGAIWYFAWLLFFTGLFGAVGAVHALIEARFMLALGFSAGASLLIPAFWIWRRKESVASWLKRRMREK